MALPGLLLVLATVLLLALSCTPRTVDARRIVAIGDLHGDLNQSMAVFRLTRLIDEHSNWIGEDTYFVQTGDVLDGGPDDIRIVELLMNMQKQARARGGDVIELLGNHEIRNLRGDFKAVAPEIIAASGGAAAREELMSMKSPIGKYLRTRNAIYRYGPFLFMHGGFSTATARLITNVNKIDLFNAELRKALVNGSISPLAQGGLNLNEDEIDDVANPILVRSILNVKCGDLVRVLRKKFKGIDSVVVGHVPHDPRDFDDWRLCGGALIDIDFGMSRWKKGDPGHVAALEIEELEDGRFHTQLIEATVAYVDRANPATLSGLYRKHYLRVATLLVILFLSIAGIFYLLRGRGKGKRAADHRDVVEYGADI